MRSGKTPLSVDPPPAFPYFPHPFCNGGSGGLGFHVVGSELPEGGSGAVVLAVVTKGSGGVMSVTLEGLCRRVLDPDAHEQILPAGFQV